MFESEDSENSDLRDAEDVSVSEQMLRAVACDGVTGSRLMGHGEASPPH